MSDVLFLLLGFGGFALMGAYAIACAQCVMSIDYAPGGGAAILIVQGYLTFALLRPEKYRSRGKAGFRSPLFHRGRAGADRAPARGDRQRSEQKRHQSCSSSSERSIHAVFSWTLRRWVNKSAVG